jgi:hypothetical protein
LPNTDVEFVRDGKGGVRLEKSTKAGTRGSDLVAALRGKWRGKLSTDEVMALTRGES